jgi:hypothetical protein
MFRFNFLRARLRKKRQTNKLPGVNAITHPEAIKVVRKNAFVELGQVVDIFEASGNWTDIMVQKQGQRAYELLRSHDLELQKIGNKKAADEVNRVREIVKPKLDKLNDGSISATQFRREIKAALKGLNLKLI